MKLKIVMPFVVVSLFANQAFSQTTHAGKEIGGPSDSWTASDSSEVNRQTLKWGIVGTLGGKSSIGLDYSINPDNVVEIACSHDREHDDDITDRFADYKDLGIFYRHYLGGTFIVGGGLIHREYKLEGEQWFGYENDSTSQFSHVLDYERIRKAFVGRLILGNQWQWKSFFVGVDWIVLDQFLGQHQTSFTSVPYAVPQTDGQRATLERAESNAKHEDYGFSKSLESINPVFRIGWSF